MNIETYEAVGTETDALTLSTSEPERLVYHVACLAIYAAHGITEDEWLNELERRLVVMAAKCGGKSWKDTK